MGVLGALLGGVLVAVAVAPHLLSELLSCQPDAPSVSLSISLDGRGLFWFDFPRARWSRAGAALPPWPAGLEEPAELLPEAELCREILGELGEALAGKVPQARGDPTTLLCLVQGAFPPALAVSWAVAGAAVTAGVTLGPWLPSADLTFVRLSQISVRPRPGDVHACVVTSERDNATAVAYWVAPDTALDEQLDTALAGAALALGLVLALLGAGLALLARRERHG